MSTFTKSVIAFVLAVIIGGAIYEAYLYPTQSQPLGSAVGSTFVTDKIASINFTPSTSAASSTSILNTDGSTRYITDSFVSCNGTNGQGFTLTGATTTIANLGLQGNANFALNVIATTTTVSQNMYSASSTEGVLTYISRIWPAGVYLTMDASAVNAGVCTVGVHYLAS